MVDVKPWTHAEHVNPMPHGGFDVAHHIPILDHPAKEPTHAISPSCESLTTGLWKRSNKRVPFWAKSNATRSASASHDHRPSTWASAASVSGSHKVISIAWDIARAVDSAARACSAWSVCAYSVPRPR